MVGTKQNCVHKRVRSFVILARMPARKGRRGLWGWVRRSRPRRRAPAKAYLEHKEAARALITERLHHFNQHYGLSWNRVAIRDQRRCWGSCSSKGNLNFSYKLLFLPPCLRDYIIIHELCHLKVLNHSTEFWATVAVACPDYKTRAGELRRIEKTLGTSLVALRRVQHSHDCTICTRPTSEIRHTFLQP